MEKNVKGFLLPSSDPLNFQYSRRLWKDSKSSGNRQEPRHPKSSWRSLTSPGFQPDLPWSSTTSCCCRALTLTAGEQSRLKSWNPWKAASQSAGTWSSGAAEGGEWGAALGRAGAAPGPAHTGEVCSGTCHHPRCVFAAGARFMGSSPPLLLGRFKIPRASQMELDLQQSLN